MGDRVKGRLHAFRDHSKITTPSPFRPRDRASIFNLLPNQIHNAPKVSLLGGYPEGFSKQTSNYVGMEIFPSPEYHLVAQSCRAYGEKVEDPKEVEPALRRGLERVKAGQAALIDVRLARP